MDALEHSTRRQVLITGASGQIGRALAQAWRHQYSLSLVDERPFDDGGGARRHVADVSRLSTLRPLCSGVDTIVHLAGGRKPQSTWSDLRQRNIRTMWVALKAAREAGCRRLIFASSILVGADPDLPYAQAKRLCERLGERYASTGSLSVINLRLGRFVASNDPQLFPGAWYLPRVLIAEDAVQVFTRAVEAPAALESATFTVISANRHPEFDVSDARARLGYAPVMDAFAIADRRFSGPTGLLRRARAWVRKCV